MDWLTQDEIKKAAETSLLAAVRCSKKHWWQGATASSRELRAACKAELFSIGTTHCALCHIYLDQRKPGCPLKHKARRCRGCCQEWADASFTFHRWLQRRDPHSDFTKAARKLHKRLCLEEKKLLAKKAG